MMNTRLDLNLMLALEALLSERNVTRAAKRLNISQPALSTQLARLRSLFGDPLFVPTSRGVVPTERAIELQNTLRNSLDDLRALIQSREVFDPLKTTMTFSFSATDYVQLVLLLPLMLKLRAVTPSAGFMIRLGDSRTAAAELESGAVHIAFLEPHNVDATLRSESLFRDNYVGIASKQSNIPDKVTIDEFLMHQHVIVSPRAEGFKTPTDTALAAIGKSRTVGLAVSSFLFLLEAVAGSDMIALAPARLVAMRSTIVKTFQVPITVPSFTVAMVWHDRCHSHPGHAWMRNQVRSVFPEHN